MENITVSSVTNILNLMCPMQGSTSSHSTFKIPEFLVNCAALYPKREMLWENTWEANIWMFSFFLNEINSSYPDPLMRYSGGRPLLWNEDDFLRIWRQFDHRNNTINKWSNVQYVNNSCECKVYQYCCAVFRFQVWRPCHRLGGGDWQSGVQLCRLQQRECQEGRSDEAHHQ